MELISCADKIRLDKYLQDKLDCSRSKIQKMIDDGDILVNDKVVKSNYLLKLDDKIIINFQDEKIDIVPENIDLDIYYEDDDVIVINKESGMVVHPAPGNYSHTLVNALMYHCNNLSDINGKIRPGIVHRIDADTSGLLLCAKNNEAHVNLAKQIEKKQVTREYIALVHGVIPWDNATIDAPIGRDEKDRKKMAVTSTNSKNAVTHVEVLERYKNATLIKCKLETGRTHQIRVHLAYIGYPIVNDEVYGRKKQDDSTFGQMLHAAKIGFKHPKTDKYLEFEAPVPDKFKEILKKYQNFE